MPFGKENTDVVGNVGQAANGLAHVIGLFLPVRSSNTDVRVPLVPERVSDLVDAFSVELAVALEPASDVPTLTADIFDQLFGGVPAVELHVDGPASGQQRAERF